MNGFALSNILMIKNISLKSIFEEFTVDFCSQKINANLLALRLLRVNDDYTKELKRRCRKLTGIYSYTISPDMEQNLEER